MFSKPWDQFQKCFRKFSVCLFSVCLALKLLICAQYCVRSSQEGYFACWVTTKQTGAFLNLDRVKPYISNLFWCLLLQSFSKWIDPVDIAGQIRCISLEGKRLVILRMRYKHEQAFVHMLLGKINSAFDYKGDVLKSISWYGKAAARPTWPKVFSTPCECTRWTWPRTRGCWQGEASVAGRSFPSLACSSTAVKRRRRTWQGRMGKSNTTEGGMPGSNRKNNSRA